jgi:hypothetical protein
LLAVANVKTGTDVAIRRLEESSPHELIDQGDDVVDRYGSSFRTDRWLGQILIDYGSVTSNRDAVVDTTAQAPSAYPMLEVDLDL